MNGFKITLLLRNIFNDHRGVCRIFVNVDKMKKIEDLESRIAQIFNIKNFYLMAENEFLPSQESIRILNPNDMISAIPLQTHHEGVVFENHHCKPIKNAVNIKDSSSEKEEKECERKKRKKKIQDPLLQTKKTRYFYSSSLVDEIDELGENQEADMCTSTPLDTYEVAEKQIDKSKKPDRKEKKLKKTNLSNAIEETCSREYDEESNQHKNRVKEKVEYFTQKINHLPSPIKAVPKCQLDKEQETQPKNASTVDMYEQDTLNISDLMRKHKLYVKPNECSKIISTELPQEHNVVKSIVVSMDTSKECNSSEFHSVETSKSQCTDNLEMVHKDIELENKVNILQHIILTPDRTAKEATGHTDNNIRGSSTSEPHSIMSDKLTDSQPQEQFVTRRKRVRVRKRKSKQPKPEAKAVIPNFDFKTKMLNATPIIHIKFDDDGNKVNCDDSQSISCEVLLADKVNEMPQEINYDLINLDSQQKVDEKNCSVEIVENGISVPKERNNETTVETEKDYAKYISDTIDKYTPMIDTMPNVGNTIAFKILTLGFSFTPELSSYIIGKVLDMSEDEKSITVNIIDGLEEAKKSIQCLSFSTDKDPGGIEVGSTQTYEWRHLVDPRLVSE